MPSDFAMPGCPDWKQSRPPVHDTPELDTANSPKPPPKNPMVIGIRTIGARNHSTDLSPTVTASLLSPTQLTTKAETGRRYR